MSEKKAVAEKMIVAEIVRALSYLKGVDISAEEKRQIAEEQNYQLIRDAQLLREAVMLRQQREAAEFVRENIQAEKAAKRPGKGLLPS